MTQFKVAHFRHQGQTVTLVQVSRDFGSRSQHDQQAIYAQLQTCATSAGLAGAVALVWMSGNRLHSYGPTQWRPFLQSLTPNLVAANTNGTLNCG